MNRHLPHNERSAFTLVELLIVIAIVAILAVVVVVVINPGELLAQSRDARRISDLATLNGAIKLYITDQQGASSYSLGSSTATYLSVPDPTASSTCGGLGGNFSANGGFHCASTTAVRSTGGTGWIPVNLANIAGGAPISVLPVDPVNTTSSNLYYSYQTNGGSFRIAAMPESQKYLAAAGKNPLMFTTGSNTYLDGGYWVLVPGNAQFGTSNFYVMKYDPACASISTGAAQTTPTDHNGYANNSKNCTAANGLAPAALPNAIPIVDISQTSAASYCAAIGAHLITNNEWQTISWNVQNLASNWSGGVVGSGSIPVGHDDSTPGQASVASANDAQNCVGTDGPASCGGTGSATTQARTVTLSNGSVIWDFAGNAWQWTNNTITGTNEPNGGSAGWNFSQYNLVTSWGSMSQSTVGAVNAAWDSGRGIGYLYSEKATDSTVYGFLRGGSWTYTDAGVEALHLNVTPSYASYDTSFRCAR